LARIVLAFVLLRIFHWRRRGLALDIRTLYPLRPTGGCLRLVLFLDRCFVLRLMRRLVRLTRNRRPLRQRRRWCLPTCRAEWIGLTDQARELGERIAVGSSRPMLIAAAIVIVSRERSVRISIGHRDDASPSGKLPPPTQTKRTSPHWYSRGRSSLSRRFPVYRISSGAWTPKMPSPDAKTDTTP
jgi:hypothetical protein